MNRAVEYLNGRDRMEKDNLIERFMRVRSCVCRLFEGVRVYDHYAIFDVHMRTAGDATAIDNEEDGKKPFGEFTQSLSHRSVSLFFFASKCTINSLKNNEMCRGQKCFFRI